MWKGNGMVPPGLCRALPLVGLTPCPEMIDDPSGATLHSDWHRTFIRLFVGLSTVIQTDPSVLSPKGYLWR